jgi:hypothetical protein
MPYHVAARRTVRGIFALCLLLGVASRGASAQTLSNLGTAKGADTVQQSFSVAQPFITGTNSAGYTLTNVSLVLDVARPPAGGGGDDDGPTYGPLYVTIYSSSGSSVGSPLTDGLLTGSLAYGTSDVTLASASTLLLAPSTEYWIVASTNATASEYAWFEASNQSSSGDIGWSIPGGFDYSINKGATWSSSSSDELFSLNAQEVAAPEPQTWACLLLALGAVGLVKLARRRRAQS